MTTKIKRDDFLHELNNIVQIEKYLEQLSKRPGITNERFYRSVQRLLIKINNLFDKVLPYIPD